MIKITYIVTVVVELVGCYSNRKQNCKKNIDIEFLLNTKEDDCQKNMKHTRQSLNVEYNLEMIINDDDDDVSISISIGWGFFFLLKLKPNRTEPRRKKTRKEKEKFSYNQPKKKPRM